MKDYLLISDAAKEVCVESHVLRYWEEELSLPIKRNELGHRYYTAEDVERFRQIKDLKDRGLQLRAIKMLMASGRLEAMGGVLPTEHGFPVRAKDKAEEEGRGHDEKDGSGCKHDEEEEDGLRREAEEGGRRQDEKDEEGRGHDEEEESGRERDKEEEDERDHGMGIEILEVRDFEIRELSRLTEESREERAGKLQWLLCQMIRETVRENNQELCKTIHDSIVKELDDQFRMQEEREEKRNRDNQQRGEEYYRRVDELLRRKLTALENEGEAKKTKKKRHFIF